MREFTDIERSLVRAWQDRKPPMEHSWRDWYFGDSFMATMSARTGPDKVDAKQKCDCDTCSMGRVGLIGPIL
jgi:hypothetical protein